MTAARMTCQTTTKSMSLTDAMTRGYVRTSYHTRFLVRDDPAKPDPAKPDPAKPDPAKPDDKSKTLVDLLKDPKYQEEFDDLLESRLARERAKYRGNDEEKAELERLRKEAKERERKQKEAEGNYQAALESVNRDVQDKEKKWNDERSGLLNEIKQDRCFSRLVSEAGALGAIKPEQVARLLADRVDLDDDRKVVVLGEDHKPWLRAGKPVAIKDLVEKFKADEPHLFKADNTGKGSESKGGNETSDGVGDRGDELAAAQEAYDKAHTAALNNQGDVGLMNKAREARRKLEEVKAKKGKEKAA